MAVRNKVKNTFLSGVALCIISILLLFLGTLGVLSKNAEVDTTYFFVPLFFLVIGIMAIAASRENNSKIL
jgi:hypothetical protein